MKGAVGSIENPFENVHAAFEHILKIEQEALSKDKYRALLKHQGICCDMNGNIVPQWLQPDTALMAEEYPEDAFIVTKQQPSNAFQFKPNLSHRKFLFRGQVQDYPTCKPGLFRAPNQDYFLSEMILQHEMWCLIDSHPLVQLLGKRGTNLIGVNFKMFTNYGGICQHYFNRTRFLDLTSDVETTKFFACCDYNQKDDTYSPHTEDGVGVIYFYEIVMPMAFQKIPPGYAEPYFHLSTIGKQIFPRSGAQHGYLMDLSKGMDFNKLHLTHKVYFKHHAVISEEIFKHHNQGLKIMPPSILDEYWREKMATQSTFQSVSEAAIEINRQFNPHETRLSLQKKIRTTRIYD
ncbi:MAG: FRG domain-containing protein [Muribaculum sp.]|nr:FRG domain-containing protein [Muribaculum sp.]